MLLAGAGLVFVLTGAAAFLVVELGQARRRDPLRRVCPDCGGSDVRPSFPGGPRDGLYRRFGCEPYRCRACRRRFYRPERHHLADQAKSH